MIMDTQEGRRHAISVITSAIHAPRSFVDLSETLENLKRSAEGKPNDYRTGVMEVVGMVEGRLNERA